MKSFHTQLLEVARKMTRRRQEKRSEKVEERRIREVDFVRMTKLTSYNSAEAEDFHLRM